MIRTIKQLARRRDFWRSEAGFMTGLNIVAMLFCLILTSFLMNVGASIVEKISLQNTADAVARTGAVVQARAMNSITATNHIIGELNAMVIVHHAVGGGELDQGRIGNSIKEDRDLDPAARAARAAGASTPAYNTVRERSGVRAGATLLDAKKVLKKLLTWVYRGKVVAKAMQAWPPTAPAGHAMEAALNAFEMVILKEYVALSAYGAIARTLLPAKKLIRDTVMPAAKEYTTRVVRETPDLAEKAATQIAKLNRAIGTLHPVRPELPVEVDPLARAMTLPNRRQHLMSSPPPISSSCPSVGTAVTRDQIVKVTQLARASFPWVNYHRQPVLQILAATAPLSKATKFYFDHSNGFSKKLCDRFQRGRLDMGLYVIKGEALPDRGVAKWSQDGAEADKLFCVMGVAGTDFDLFAGNKAYRNPLAKRFAYSQAMLYNANPQKKPRKRINLRCKRIVPIRQADIGWDTLNWAPGTRPYELLGIGISPEQPKITLNWQAKLVPVTSTCVDRLRTGSDLPADFRELIDGLLPNLPRSLRTH